MSGEKRKRDERLYTPTWECPVCYDELGVDAGVVPCVITSCRPVAHLVCYTCAQRDALRKNAPCPLCRTPIVNVLPLGALVDEAADAAARAALDRIDPSRIGAQDAVARVVSAAQEQLSDSAVSDREIVAKRVQKVVERVALEDSNGKIPMRQGAVWYFWFRTPYAWDTRWRMKCRVPGKASMSLQQLRTYLGAEAAKCNEALAQVYRDAPYSVQMTDDQVRPPAKPRSQPVYLCFRVQRR